MQLIRLAVVPYYFLVWYNLLDAFRSGDTAVVPYYFLVWYNLPGSGRL